MWYMSGHRSVQQIPIYVETFSGTTFEIQILPQETIYCLKMKLQEDEGIQASQQHLIWQGEELKDDFTLEDYGIGFGAILRLILELRGGPLNPPIQVSPTNNRSNNLCTYHHHHPVGNGSTEDDDRSTRSGQDDGNEGDRAVFDSQSTNGIVIFQDGNEITIYSPGQRRSRVTTDNTGDRSSIGSADPLSGSTMDNMINEARANEQRQKENDALKVKMREIQTKMKSLALQRCKNLPGTNLIKLPLIVDKNSHGSPLSFPATTLPKLITNDRSNCDTIKTPAGLIFPPLITTTNDDTSPSLSLSSLSSSSSSSTIKLSGQMKPLGLQPIDVEEKVELRRAQSKLIEQLTRKNYQLSKRFSGNIITRRFSSQTINFDHHQQLIGQSGYSSSSPPSALVVKNDKVENDQRPKTSPFLPKVEDNCSTLKVNCSQSIPLIIGKVNNELKDNNNDDIQLLLSSSSPVLNHINKQSGDQGNQMSRKGSINNLTEIKSDQPKSESHQIKVSKDSIKNTNKGKNKILPPVGKTRSKSNQVKSKNRCYTCNKRLGLATRYDCRCGQMFCTVHRYSEAHDCKHDYKAEGRRLIALNNPVIKAPKLPKI